MTRAQKNGNVWIMKERERENIQFTAVYNKPDGIKDFDKLRL